MNHRGACACDNDTGDGAGVLCAIPHEYYAAEIRFVIILLINNSLNNSIFFICYY